MPTDNVALPAASGKAASRDVTYSGESAQVQAVAIATVAGSDDAKTATDVSAASPFPVVQTGALPAGANNIGAVDVNQRIVDNAAFTDGTTYILPVAYYFDEVAGTALTENDVAIPRIDAKRSTIGVIEDATTRGQRASVDTTGRLAIAPPGIVRVTQTPTVSTTPAYTAKDAVGGLLTFANAVRASGGSGQILTVTVYDLSQQRPSLELVLFDRTFTNSTDNAVFDPTDGDLANCIGVVAINSWSDFNDNSIATVSAVGLGFVLNGTSLFGQLLTRGTPTFVGTSDIKVDIEIQQL